MRTGSRAKARQLDAVGQTQRERLAHLEYKAFFCGELRRGDLERRFGIKAAAATRDIATYRLIAPDNLAYDLNAKAYLLTAKFRPALDLSVDRALAWLRQGFGDGLQLNLKRPIACEGPTQLNQPNLSVLAVLTRAMHKGYPLAIRYLSLSSGESKREVVPFALVDNGLRWHIRAYDRANRRFSDFVVTRISLPRILGDKPADEELPPQDIQWNRIVDLELVPHPRIQHKKAVEADYGLSGGVLKLRVRAALAGYALHRWQVDCSPDHRLDSSEHHLWLGNPQTLYGVESAVMAPGYQSKAGTSAGPQETRAAKTRTA